MRASAPVRRWSTPGGGDVADAPAGVLQPPLPVLLVAVEVEARVEAAGPLQRPPPQRQVRAPHELGVAVVGAEVERGHRRRLAPAGVQVRALEARPDRAAEGVVVRLVMGGGEQRAEPAGPRLGVVVEEAQEVGLRQRDRGVARRVEPARLAVGRVARAVLGGELRRLRVGRIVLDHDQLGAVLGGLRRGRGQRDGEVFAPAPGGDEDGGNRGHRRRSLGSPRDRYRVGPRQGRAQRAARRALRTAKKIATAPSNARTMSVRSVPRWPLATGRAAAGASAAARADSAAFETAAGLGSAAGVESAAGFGSAAGFESAAGFAVGGSASSRRQAWDRRQASDRLQASDRRQASNHPRAPAEPQPSNRLRPPADPRVSKLVRWPSGSPRGSRRSRRRRPSSSPRAGRPRHRSRLCRRRRRASASGRARRSPAPCRRSRSRSARRRRRPARRRRRWSVGRAWSPRPCARGRVRSPRAPARALASRRRAVCTPAVRAASRSATAAGRRL